MSDQPSFPLPPAAQTDETTGRLIVTFREDATTEGMAAVRKGAGISKLASAADFEESAFDIGQLDAAGGAVFPTLGIAVVSADGDVASSIMAMTGEDSPVLAVEPERIFYAVGVGPLSDKYFQGYRDGFNHLFDVFAKQCSGYRPEEDAGAEAPTSFVDDSQSTWGLKATKVLGSNATGRNIKVAVLDTGFDLNHPDFLGRQVISKSFYAGEDAQDRLGHGTHCIGTACGFKDLNGRRYGIAHKATIFNGKVLGGPFGSGPTAGILAGIEWAVVNKCDVISMSLGNQVTTPSPAYEAAGRRALLHGSLIVAAAGNHGQLPAPQNTVGQPANSASIMAVAAVNNQLQHPTFSCVSGPGQGANVDIAGPGVAVYSSWPIGVSPGRYHIISGTSMATPHVSGIAALYAECFRARGWQLWQLLVSQAQRLPLPSNQVGTGLVQAPICGPR